MKKNEYVVATKYSDGDTKDHWCVGFYNKKIEDRHFVVDAKGQQFRANGFRKVKKISPDVGKYLVDNRKLIESLETTIWEAIKGYNNGVML